MTELDHRCLSTFSEWLRMLGQDALALAGLVASDAVADTAKRALIGGLSYAFKSLDLVPDGVEDLGLLDDAFILRIACRHALSAAPSVREVDMSGTLVRLADESCLIVEFLDKDYARLDKYVRDLATGAARGRTVDEVLADVSVRTSFLGDVESWCRGYVMPRFSQDEKNLIKLRAFLDAKLPA